MQSRKEFIRSTALAALPLSILASCNRKPESAADAVFSSEEDFWTHIRSQYFISKEIINLNNGGVSPQPIPVHKAHVKNLEYSNHGPTHFMWHRLDNGREPLRSRLAAMAGCSSDELAIVRNTTEGLNTIIAGLPLNKGDEVVLSLYDYPNMMNAWKQREKRDGIKLKWVDLNLPEENDDEIVRKYTAAITAQTKIVHVTHMINWTGQILPVKKIAEAAHEKGCEVMVDAAHTFAHIDFKFPDTGADYLATSLHKWLCAPFGTGLMYIKKEKIAKIYPAFASPENSETDIRKFENLGTRSFAAEIAINNAIDFHEKIGIAKKQKRLRQLKNYWAEKVKDIADVKFYTSLKDEYSCGIATFGIQGKAAGDIANFLFEKYKIHSTTVNVGTLNGVRITPHVYTSFADLDILVQGIKALTKS